MNKLFLFFFVLLVSGCAISPQAPEKLSLPISEIKELEYKPVTPLEVPSKPGDVVKFSKDGVDYAGLKVDDLKLIMKAYESAKGNAELVKDLDKLNQYYVQQVNLMRQLAEFEEYKSESRNQELDQLARKMERDRIISEIESIGTKILVIVLAIALI